MSSQGGSLEGEWAQASVVIGGSWAGSSVEGTPGLSSKALGSDRAGLRLLSECGPCGLGSCPVAQSQVRLYAERGPLGGGEQATGRRGLCPDGRRVQAGPVVWWHPGSLDQLCLRSWVL